MKKTAAFLVLVSAALVIGLAAVRWQRPAWYFRALEWSAGRFPPTTCAGDIEREAVVIAHAGGAVDRVTYSNALEALDTSYEKGCRLFELDFEWTDDGHLVLLHDWNANATRTFGDDFGGRWHSRDEFLAAARRDGLTSLDLDSLMGWLEQRPDARVVTDVKYDNLSALAHVSDRFPEAGPRVIPQIYAFGEYEPVRNMGFDPVILTLYRSDATNEEVVTFAAHHAVWAVAMPATRAVQGLPEALSAIEVPSLVHTVNSRRHARFLMSLGVRGFYSDYLVGCGGPAW